MPSPGRLMSNKTAAGTALTNSTAETVLYSTTIPANHAQVGRLYLFWGSVRATATNGTDTLTVRCRLGTTTLTGTVLWATTAVDVADNDVVTWQVQGAVRSIGASGVVLWAGSYTAPGAEGTATMRAAFESDTMDTTADNLLEITGQWSAASGSDSCQGESFALYEVA